MIGIVAPGPLVASATPGNSAHAGISIRAKSGCLLMMIAQDPYFFLKIDGIQYVGDHAAGHFENGHDTLFFQILRYEC